MPPGYGSAGVVLAHNHPERRCRAQARPTAGRRAGWPRAGEAIDLAVLDHLIFAGRECSSMRRMGLL